MVQAGLDHCTDCSVNGEGLTASVTRTIHLSGTSPLWPFPGIKVKAQQFNVPTEGACTR